MDYSKLDLSVEYVGGVTVHGNHLEYRQTEMQPKVTLSEAQPGKVYALGKP